MELDEKQSNTKGAPVGERDGVKEMLQGALFREEVATMYATLIDGLFSLKHTYIRADCDISR